MATYNGVNKAIMDAITPSTILSPGSANGKVRCFVDTYVGLGTEANAETIAMGPALPVGAKILDVIVSLNACGGTVGVGDAVGATRYGSALADATVSRLDEVAGLGYEIIATTTQILVTLSALVTAAGIITLVVFYTYE